MTIAESATDNQAAAATFTVTGAGATGLTCTPYTGTDGTGAFASGGVFSTINSVVCTGTSKGLRIEGAAFDVVVDSGVNTANPGLVIVITKAADYAVGSTVGATNSDAGLVTVAGVAPAANFVWSDLSAAAHSIFTGDWANAFLVQGLATNTQNLLR